MGSIVEAKERSIKHAYEQLKEQPQTEESIHNILNQLFEAGYYAGWSSSTDNKF